MKYTNRSGKDVQISVPESNPVEWIVIKKGETEDLPISQRRAALNGLYTEERWDQLVKEDAETKKVEAEKSSIGHVKIETKKVKEKVKDKDKVKKTSEKESKKKN